MKFLNEKGEIAEGEPISDELILLRDTITKYIHEGVCNGTYHSTYGPPPPCRIAGNQLAGILDPFDGESRIANRIIKAMEPEPVAPLGGE